MPRFLLIALTVSSVLASAAVGQPDARDDEKKPAPVPNASARTGLKAGSDLPGPFHPFNVTGPRKNSFHCLISQHGLDPAVLIFVRDREAPDLVKDLVRKLDALIEKNSAARLGAFVVFVPPDLKDAVAEDDLREDLARALDDYAKEEPALKHVVLALATPAEVAHFGLTDDVTTAAYRRYRVAAVQSIAKEKLDPAAVTKVLDDVSKLLAAPRK